MSNSQTHLLVSRPSQADNAPVRVRLRRNPIDGEGGPRSPTGEDTPSRSALGGPEARTLVRRRIVLEWPADVDAIELEVIPHVTETRRRAASESATPLIAPERQSEFPAVARVDAQFRFVEVCDNYAAMIGVTPDHLRNLLCDANVDPRDAELVQTAHEQLAATGVVEYESRAHRADESTFWQRVLMVEDRDERGQLRGYYRFMGDVSLRRQAEDTLEHREERLRAFLEAMPDPMVRVSREGVCIDCKLPTESSLGLPPGWFLGRNVRELGLDPSDLAKALELIELTLYTGQLQLCEFDIDIAGELRYFEGRVAPCGRDSVILFARDITDRRRALDLLAENERFISRLANSSPALIYVYDLRRNESIYVNQEVEAVLGFSPEEVRSLGPTPLYSLVHPSDADARLQRIRSLGAGTRDTDEGQYAESEYRVQHRDGSWRWVYCRETVFAFDPSGRALQVLGVAVDVSGQRRAADALRASEERLRLLAEHASDMISRHDAHGRFLDVSPACERILGFAPAELLELGLRDLVHRDDWIRFWTHYRHALQGTDRRVVEFRARRKRGGYLWLEATVRSTRAEDESATETVCVVRDITERRKAERDRERLQQQVYRAQRLDSLGVLAGGIAHDFNNLLFSVLGHAELALGETGVSAALRHHLEIIRSTAKQGRELTRQMLVYAGERSMEFCPTAMNDVIHEMVRLLKVGVPGGVELRFELMPDLPLIDGDVGQLNQVVMNLATNAAESITSGSGCVTFRTGTHRLRRKELTDLLLSRADFEPGPMVYLEVSDTGCGMDAATRVKVFEPFFSTKFTGRGLGLAAVLGIVRSHRGAISLTSEVGKGTTFRIYFPPSTSPVPTAPTTTDSEQPWSAHGRALVVEDDPTVRDVVRRLLERVGMQVDLAEDGVQGVARLAQAPGEYDIIFLDLIMPKMGGAQALREMKRIDPKAKIVIFSGYGELTQEGLSEDQRPTAFLQKPIDLARLRAVLRDVL